MTKAERIFNKTRFECKLLFLSHGVQYNPNGKPVSYNGLIYEEGEVVYIRTCNAVQRIIDSKKKIAQLDLKLGVINENTYEKEMYILDMVQVALDHQIATIKSFQ